jgi:protein-tyrosine-phosphatase
MSRGAKNLLFVSRRNSLRSVLAQAYVLHIGGDRFAAESCGQPGEVSDAFHPAAVAALRLARVPIPTSPPRSWAELLRKGTPRLDIVVTLDERTISSQPSWPGQPITALWSFEDAATASDSARTTEAAIQTLFALQRRLELMMSLPFHGTDSTAIRSDLRDLGRMS